jgi:hypothetical protein
LTRGLPNAIFEAGEAPKEYAMRSSYALLLAGTLWTLPKSAQAQNGCDGTPSCVEDLRDVADAMSQGANPFLGMAAATSVRRMDAAHDRALDETGVGLYYGNRGVKWEDATGTDCTTFVLEALEQAFSAAGMSEEWSKVFRESLANSGSAGFKGLELLKSLQKLGWTSTYWNPDTRTPDDGDGEHPYSYYLANKNGTYYGLPVDMSKAMTNYRPSDDSVTTTNQEALDRISAIPFGVIAARGGKHMAMILDGEIYEVHWTTGADSKHVITNEPLVEWDWLSGAVVYPSSP